MNRRVGNTLRYLIYLGRIWLGLVRYIGGLVHDCSNTIANALELLQFCIKPSIWNISKQIEYIYDILVEENLDESNIASLHLMYLVYRWNDIISMCHSNAFSFLWISGMLMLSSAPSLGVHEWNPTYGEKDLWWFRIVYVIHEYFMLQIITINCFQVDFSFDFVKCKI